MTEELFLRWVGTFLIALLRFSGFFVNMPAFGEAIVPMRIKAGLSALCALIILPHLVKTQPLPNLQVMEYGLMGIKELVLGFTMGFVVLIAIDMLKFSGEIMGMQIGFSFIQVVAMDANRGQAIIAEFFQVVGVLLFLILGGHLLFLRAFAESFDLVPLAGLVLHGGIVETVAKLTVGIFFLGLQISMPIIAIILIGDIALGIIARTVPRMNLFQVGFPIKIILGLWTITTLLPLLSDLFKEILTKTYGHVNTLLNLMH